MSPKESAAHLKGTLLECTASLDECISLLATEADQRQVSLYRGLTADVMGNIFTEALMPLYHAFPELEPEELKEARNKKREKRKLSKGLKEDLKKRLSKVEETLVSLSGEDFSEVAEISLEEPMKELKHLQTFLRRIDS